MNYKYVRPQKLSSDLLWLCPVKAEGLVRVGGPHDGGYLVPQAIIDQSEGMLSYGLGEDWSFDTHWHHLKPSDPIYMHDGTGPEYYYEPRLRWQYDTFFHTLPHVRHYKQNVGPETLLNERVVSFTESVDRMGVDQVFIKMDIERGELPILNDIVANAHRITGIVIELHDCTVLGDQFKRSVETLKQAYKIVHFHGNNYVHYGENGLTDCIELTFIRKDLCPSDELRYEVHIDELDYSNVKGSVDPQYSFEPAGTITLNI